MPSAVKVVCTSASNEAGLANSPASEFCARSPDISSGPNTWCHDADTGHSVTADAKYPQRDLASLHQRISHLRHVGSATGFLCGVLFARATKKILPSVPSKHDCMRTAVGLVGTDTCPYPGLKMCGVGGMTSAGGGKLPGINYSLEIRRPDSLHRLRTGLRHISCQP